MLAMAAIGFHARAAAIACEMSGVHPALRSLDGGLVILHQYLSSEESEATVFGGGVAVEKQQATATADESVAWFHSLLQKLRDKARRAFEKDVLL